MSDYEKLTDFEVLDLAWEQFKLPMHKKPNFLDDNAVRLVRDRITKLGLLVKFMDMLVSMCPHTSGYSHQIFEAMQATPRQQCIAALKSLEAK